MRKRQRKKIDCEEEDCEACHRGKFCDCEDKGCPHCNKDEEEEEDGMEDCDDCGYTHHFEDKCPIGEQCEKYENWREREEGDCVDDADDEDDVPCFPAKDDVPDIPPHKFIARDVDGVAWQYDAEDDEWTRSK